MNVYDFDGTVYTGDSTIDFYFFCLLKDLRILAAFPYQLKGVILYLLGKISKTEYKQYFFSFLRYIEDPAIKCQLFWDKNEFKIKKFYLSQTREDDIFISASPEFLLKEICRRLGVKYLIASRVEKDGRFLGENCRGEEKVRRFQEEFPDSTIDFFYSDSVSDEPLARLSRKAFFVKKNQIKNWYPSQDAKEKKA